jgi:hypothetical protein
MTTSEQAAVAYANAAYLRAAAISYAKSIGEPIAHFSLKPGQVTDQELPRGPLGSVLLQKRPTLQYYNTAPMWINVGFAVELGLKGLFLVTKGTTPPRGHDTSALLGLLDQSERAAIEAEMLVVVNELEISGVLEQGMDRNDLAVQSALDRFGTDFVDFRYLYEGTQLPDHAETGWIRLRAPSVWFSLDAILRVLKSKLESAGCTGIADIPFEPLAASTL